MSSAIIAINKKYQSAINKAYKNYRAYHALVNEQDLLDLDQERAIAKLENKQSVKYDAYFDIMMELPKREAQNFEKQHHAIHGYS